MDKKYWDQVAEDYDGEIFSALANDHNDVIASKICEFSCTEAVACDFGCGVGKFLPILSENFGHAYAVDISNKLLNQARDKCKELDNITYLKIDLSKAGVKLKAIDFALSVNVAIMPSEKKRSALFKTISKHLCNGGHFLLVVPSLESALYSDFRLVQWNQRAGLEGAEAVSELKQTERKGKVSVRQGIVEINNVPTKHYLEEELLALFEAGPLDVVSIEKVEYYWNTEFHRPPRWMKEPYPWDWMVVLEKT